VTGGESIKALVEAALFAAGEPLSIERLTALLEADLRPSRQQVLQAVEALVGDYESRGIELKEVASGYRFQVRAEYAPWVSRLWAERPARYSRALLETLAIIAYRQPLTRAEIEEIRGVSVSTQIVRTLIDREWIRLVGHRDVPGRPAVYGTTRQFLDYFGLASLSELPSLDDIQEIIDVTPELDLAPVPGGESQTTAPGSSRAEEAAADRGNEYQGVEAAVDPTADDLIGDDVERDASPGNTYE
jgi:segregation and condensation protein B